MPKRNSVKPQEYPRLPHSSLLDDSRLQQHTNKIPLEELKKIILTAIENANKKSSREILNILDDVSEYEAQKKYQEEGKKLFQYFRQYCGDPASTAYECLHKHYVDVGKEQFRNKTLQRRRMNSGWRYQFIAKDLANASNYSYEEIAQAVLEVLLEASKPDPLEYVIPEELLTAFGACCAEKQLVDANGFFNDAHALVDFFASGEAEYREVTQEELDSDEDASMERLIQLYFTPRNFPDSSVQNIVITGV